MKMFKRVLTLCMVAAMLASMLVLASCGLFKNKVLKTMDKLENAKSYTYEEVSFDKDGKQTGTKTITKVDFKNLAVYTVKVNAEGKTTSETYYYFDKDAEKYYSASVDAEGKVTYKAEVKEKDFFSRALGYVELSSSAIYEKALDWGVYEKVDGALVYDDPAEKDNESGSKMTIKVEDKALIYESESSFMANGKVEVTGSSVDKYYDINKTEIEIPQAVLDAKAAEVKE